MRISLLLFVFAYVKCIKLELNLYSDCSSCDQANIMLQLQTTDADSNTAVSSGGIWSDLMVECCNDVENISINWTTLDSVATSTDRSSCCFSFTFHKGELKLTMMLNDLFRDKWFCTAQGSVSLSIDRTSSDMMPMNQLTVNRLWEEVFNKTQQCFDDDNDVTLLTFQSSHHLNEHHSVTCSKVETDGDEELPLYASCTNDRSTTHPNNIIPSKTRPYDYSTISSRLSPSTTMLLHIYCSDEGRQWPTTLANTNHTITGGCYNGTANATRRCGIDGVWHTVYCIVDDWFTDVIDQASMSTEQALVSLTDLTTNRSLTTDRNVSLVQIVFLLDHVLRTQIEHDENNTESSFTTTFMETTNHLINAVGSDVTYNANTKRSIGSQLLLTLDDLALRVANASKEAINISNTLFLKALKYENASFDEPDVIGIEVNGNSISVPSELLAGVSNVRIGSFYHDNLSHILPPIDHNNSIVSSVISSSIICQSCSSISEINRNITIKLHVKDHVLMSGDNIMCVFLDIERNKDSFLPSGSWNTSGCSTTINYTTSTVMCSCNHLTNFAILLAPKGIQVSDTHYQILSIIGRILVPISIVCMLVIVFTYTLIRSLWSLRNYVHVMMCTSLCVAQIVFVAGVDKIENKSVCSGIAVVLQYLFLVCFMWMLMEGVVLYVMLIRVIIKHPKCYAFAFTISCYVIPAMYMSAMVPVGFLYETDDLPDHTHYLYYIHDVLTACWLNYDSGFIWSFIAPVITILLINIGFFIMAIVVMVRHLKNKQRANQELQKKINFRSWLQVSVSLTVVMGLTWLVGVVVYIKDFVFMSYLTTVFIGGQGILLFTILVPLSKQVRDAYLNVLKRNRLFSSMSSSELPSTATNGITPNKRNGSSDIVNNVHEVCS